MTDLIRYCRMLTQLRALGYDEPAFGYFIYAVQFFDPSPLEHLHAHVMSGRMTQGETR